MPDKTIYEIILEREHPTLKERKKIHTLIYDSYNGGVKYAQNGYLHFHTLESNDDYAKRSEQSTFISHTKTLIDTIVGFLYQVKPQRTYAPELQYVIDTVNPTQSLDAFIQKTACLSTLFTVAVLVDSPAFDPEEVRTIDDRQSLGLNPYVKRYMPWQITDYSMDSKGLLNWIIFIDNYQIADDPFKVNEEVIVRSVWTKTECNKFYYKEVKKGNGEKKIVFDHEEKIVHGLGEVPVLFLSFRDLSDEIFEESFAENIALLDQKIYNYLSLLDCLLAKNAIKPLMYPCEDGKIPDSLKSAGKVSKLVVIPFPGNFTNKPYFLEANNTDIQSYLTTIDMLLKEILNLVGLSQDQNYAVSGKAKIVELKKLEVLLIQGVKSLQKFENDLFRLFCLWERKDYNYEIKYNVNFQEEDISEAITRLFNILTIDSKTLKSIATKEIVQKSFQDIDEQTMDQILSEIDDQTNTNEIEPGIKSDESNIKSAGLKPVNNKVKTT
jgi:hypothetical protein